MSCISKHNSIRFTALVLVLCPLLSMAQNFKRQYRDAKDLYDNADYSRALGAFKPLIEYDKENPYSQYASYYYGLSAYKLGFGTVAKDIFLQTKKLYPGWEQMDEVNFMLARIYFDQHEYFHAMSLLDEIHDSGLAVDLTTMKRYYLSQISDPETLRMMLEDHPNEAPVAIALVKAIGMRSPADQDVRLFDSLVTRYGLDRRDYITENTLTSRKKERYRVALLLPFLASSLDPTPVTKRNQYVLDLYTGMKVAADTLAHEGIFIDLLAYDVELNAEATRRVLTMPELRSSDVLVGPLFSDQAKLVLDYSERNKISMINPVSNNSEFIGTNPFAMLFQPSQATLGLRSAEEVAALSSNKKCIVYFGESPRDSIKAFSFIKKALELGVKVVYAEEVHKENSNRIFTALATGTEFDEFRNPTQFTMKRDSIGSIYVASDDPVIFTKVISGVETRGDSILIVGNESWISGENATIDYGLYERLGIVFESPNFVPIRDPAYIEFRRNFIKDRGTIPSNYTWMGYDFMRFAGRSLAQYGVYFEMGLAQESTAADRFDFRGSRDNQVVPFVRFSGGELVRISEIGPNR